MKSTRDGDAYYFVDEAGDPTFFNAKGKLIVGQPGCSKQLIIGYVRIKHDPSEVRSRILKLQAEVVANPDFQKFASLKHTAVAFHASNDAPPIRELVFDLLAELRFSVVFVVSQKDKLAFQKRSGGNADRYYDGVISRLFRDALHSYSRNHICFAARGSRPRQKPLEMAIEKAREQFTKLYLVTPQSQTFVTAQSPKGEPCLSVIDYAAWALQRAYTTGEMQYYQKIYHKVGMVWEQRARKAPECYNSKRPFLSHFKYVP